MYESYISIQLSIDPCCDLRTPCIHDLFDLIMIGWFDIPQICGIASGGSPSR